MPHKKGSSLRSDAGVDAAGLDLERCPGGGFVPRPGACPVPELEAAGSARDAGAGARGGRGGSRAAGPAGGQIGSVGNNFSVKGSAASPSKGSKIFRGKKGAGASRGACPPLPPITSKAAREWWRLFRQWQRETEDARWAEHFARDPEYQRVKRALAVWWRTLAKARREAKSCAKDRRNFQQKGGR